MKNLQNISVVIITKDVEDTIERTLQSLVEFPEVIIYDTGSIDNTIQIVEQFHNSKIVLGKFVGFGKTKNLAVKEAKNSWILSLDGDEYINENLVRELDSLELKRDRAYSILRDNYVLGKKMRWSGLGRDWLVRLFHRDVYSFKELSVHEFVDVGSSNIQKVKNSFSHIAVSDPSQILLKIAKYSKLSGDSLERRYSIYSVLLKTVFAFFRTYILKGGFLDGWRGVLISLSNANGRFYKYIRQVED